MQIITLKQKKDLIFSIFGEGATSSNGKDVAVFCPICKKSSKAKKKKKLSIVIETGVYHCWVCEAKGKNLARFIKLNCKGFRDLEKVKSYFGITEEKYDEVSQEKVLSLPPDFKMIALSNTFTANYMRDYLFSRGMNESDLYRFKPGYSFEFGFENRIIFPSLDDDLKLNFYLTRTCEDLTKYSKYKNCDAQKKKIIFNESLIEWKEPVIIVEGVFDAVKAGPNSVPILGSWIDKSYKIFQRIVSESTPVILGLDPDVKDKEIKIARSLFENGIEVKILQNNDKDLGDMSPEEVKKLIVSAKHFDNMERVRYLISGIKSGSIF